MYLNTSKYIAIRCHTHTLRLLSAGGGDGDCIRPNNVCHNFGVNIGHLCSLYNVYLFHFHFTFVSFVRPKTVSGEIVRLSQSRASCLCSARASFVTETICYRSYRTIESELLGALYYSECNTDIRHSKRNLICFFCFVSFRSFILSLARSHKSWTMRNPHHSERVHKIQIKQIFGRKKMRTIEIDNVTGCDAKKHLKKEIIKKTHERTKVGMQ